jgi:hypothetical protein
MFPLTGAPIAPPMTSYACIVEAVWLTVSFGCSDCDSIAASSVRAAFTTCPLLIERRRKDLHASSSASSVRRVRVGVAWPPVSAFLEPAALRSAVLLVELAPRRFRGHAHQGPGLPIRLPYEDVPAVSVEWRRPDHGRAVGRCRDPDPLGPVFLAEPGDLGESEGSHDQRFSRCFRGVHRVFGLLR